MPIGILAPADQKESSGIRSTGLSGPEYGPGCLQHSKIEQCHIIGLYLNCQAQYEKYCREWPQAPWSLLGRHSHQKYSNKQFQHHLPELSFMIYAPPLKIYSIGETGDMDSGL